jgi:dienelactone hydrolase
MRTLAFAVLLAFPTALAAQENLNVLKDDPKGVPARKMLRTYLTNEAQKQFDARRQTIAGLKTAEDVSKRQAELRARFIEALGGFPERTPLNAKVVGTEQRDGYRVERILYESRPNHHVTANFYVPDGKGPFPGVLVPCGHSKNGKAANQQPCVILARHGIAAMSYDPIGQGERVQLLDNGQSLVGGNTNEHTMVGIGALLVGQSTATYRIWDGMRSLDYLASRPEIDPKRLGCTGCSGGGTLTSYLMALDERIVAAAPSCYITSLERLFATIGPQDAEQNITGQVAFGMEHADYLLLRAPKPTLILCATQDFFNIQGTWTTFREAKQVYGIDGFGERVDLFEYNTTHGYPKPQREAMLRFMRRWLLHKDDALTEEPFTAAKDAQLQCTRTGQVLEDFKGKSVFDFNVERELELAKQRSKWQEGHSREDLLKEVRRSIGLAPTIAPAKLEQLGEISRDGYAIRKLLFTTEPGVSVPALFFVAKDAGAQTPIVLYAHGDGKSADAAAGGPIEKLVKSGNRVLTLDLRGFGETAAGVANAGRPSLFGVDFSESFMGIHLNRPLLGQRTHDLLSVVAWLTQEPATKLDGYALIGIGSAGPAALHATAVEPRIKSLTLEKSLVSWSAVVKTPVSYNQLTNVVPGALKVYDLPDLVKAIAPRKVTINNPVDPVGKPVAQGDKGVGSPFGGTLPAANAAQPPAERTPDALPRVVLIGDSIRMGYAPLVAKRLDGKAVVISDKENGGDSSNVLKHLDDWAIKEKPAVIHFNCGLHDLKVSRKTKVHQIEIDAYEANLKQIADRLKKETSAALVFTSTTPIHDERHAARKDGIDRTEADVKRYNDRPSA